MNIFIFITFFILYFSLIPPLAAQTDTPQADRRIEEEKRKNLLATEANYYDASSIRVDKQEISTSEYFNALAKKDIATCADAAYVLNVLFGHNQVFLDFSDRKQFLIDRKLLPKKNVKKYTQNAPIHRGLFARMLLSALEIKGGLTLRMLGNNQRYAHKELVYEGIMVSGSSAEYMSGEELIYTYVQAFGYLEYYKKK